MIVLLVLALVALAGTAHGFLLLAGIDSADPGKDRAMGILLVAILILAFVAGGLAERVL